MPFFGVLDRSGRYRLSMTFVALLLSIAAFVYLVYAMVFPEKF